QLLGDELGGPAVDSEDTGVGDVGQARLLVIGDSVVRPPLPGASLLFGAGWVTSRGGSHRRVVTLSERCLPGKAHWVTISYPYACAVHELFVTQRSPARWAPNYSESLHPIMKIVSRSEEHTSELQSRFELVCGLLLEKKE